MSEKNFNEHDFAFKQLLDEVLTQAMGSPHPLYKDVIAEGWSIRGEIHGSSHYQEIVEDRAEANRLVEEIRNNPMYVTPSPILTTSAVLPVPQGPPQAKRPRADSMQSAGTEADWGGAADDETMRSRPGPPGSSAGPRIREATDPSDMGA